MCRSYWSSIAVSLLVLVFTGCSGGADKRTNPTPRPSVAYQTNTVGPGAACPNGGVQVNVGIDDNGNGTLETTEIDGTEYVCHGAPGVDGKTSLVSITPEAAGVNCVAGGLRVRSGLDANDNGTLDAPAEVETTEYVCNGVNGTDGAPSLVRTSAVSAGPRCATGGYLLEAGIDDDRNGTLDDPEVDASAYVCNPGATSLVRVIAEPAGSHCPAAGVVVQSGTDDDGDGTLAAGEVDSSEYVCNGQSAPEPAAITPLPLIIANDMALFNGTLDTADRRLSDGTRAELYSFTMAQAGTVDLSSIPGGAVEFHVFTTACLSSSDLETWSTCFVGRATPKVRLDSGNYVLLVKGTETAYLWGSTPYQAILRRIARTAIGGATISEHILAGRSALQDGLVSSSTDDFLRAIEHYQAAAALINLDPTATAADLNRARFYGGLTRIAILLQPYSDLVAGNGLNDVGDLLDGFGLGGTPFQRSNLETIDLTTCTDTTQCGYYGCWSTSHCEPKQLSTDSPRGQEVQAFLRDHVSNGLRSALTLLEAVDAGLVSQIVDQGHVVQLDYADALFARAIAHGMLAAIQIQQSYDLDADLDEVQTNASLRDDRGSHVYDQYKFLQEYPFFLKLKSAASLPQARTDALAAIDAFRLALQALRAETDDQSDDLITISDETCYWNGYTTVCTPLYNPAAKIADLDADLVEARAALDAPGNYTFTMDTPADTTDDVTVNASAFFAGVDLRSKLPVRFDLGPQHDRPGLFPDTTFGGVLVSSPSNVNEDLDADGSPDLLNDTYTKFFGSYFAGNTFWAPYYGYCSWDPYLGYTCFNSWGPLTFAATGNTFTFFNQYEMTTNPGTYSYSGNVLTLTFDAALGGMIKTVTVTADEIRRDGFGHQTLFRDEYGTITYSSWDWWHR